MGRNPGGGTKRWVVGADAVRPPDDPVAKALLQDLIVRHPGWTTQQLRIAFRKEWQAIEALHRGG